MASPRILNLFFQPLLLSILLKNAFQVFSQRTHSITSISSISDPHSIISRGNIFKFGFFTPKNSTNRYLGIFYVVSEETVVWVANRNKPLTDSSNTVTISRNGNLVLSNGQNETVWSTNTTSSSPLNTTAQILDTGNLVLRDVSSGRIIWESFSHPVDVLLPNMKVSDNVRTGEKVVLSSWKTPSDPAVGNFTAGIQAMNIPQLFVWDINGRPRWRSGPWNGQNLLGVLQDLRSLYPNNFPVMNDNDTYYVVSPGDNNFLVQFSLNSSGFTMQNLWDYQRKTWRVMGSAPEHECDVYGKCGPFGSCNRDDSPICSCLKGFEPRDEEEWGRGNWSGGCVRRKQLQCGRGNDTEGNGDGFLRLQFMKVPDFAERFWSRREDECGRRCLRNCSCIAYAYDQNIGCMFWSGSLIDVQRFPGVGPELHIRLERSELDGKRDSKRLLIILVIVASTSVFILCIFVCWRWIMKKKEKSEDEIEAGRKSNEWQITSGVYLNSNVIRNDLEKANIEEFPLFPLEILAMATNQFCQNRLLGKGGFGPVYKGILQNGKEVAIKRLSAASGQGTKEFMNEVMVISKLQHRNLVKLIGCCVEQEEKMLVYEYMPNKSLDACLFGHRNKSSDELDWKKRFNIIEGIARGLMYLHKDSRLRIIHRDLKPSNVLLDEDWNAKISDFGMARIFGRNQEHDNTGRIVGTLGYMAPEYAMDGRFSEKSDVYGFGVLMLEILSGKKNVHYYNHDLSLGLVGCAWKFWSEENGLAFIDQILITDSNFNEEMVRCIHIALLCIQEFPEDRPDIQTILSMISHEILDLPDPEQPVFAEKWSHFHTSTDPTNGTGLSINMLTMTELNGR